MAVNKDKYHDISSGVGISKENADATNFIGIDEATGDLIFEDELTGEWTLTELRESPGFKHKHIDAMFNNNGATSNKWLGLESSSDPSNEKPYLLRSDVMLSSLTFIGITDDADTDIEVYKNGVLWFTWEIRNRRLAYKSNVPASITASAGDNVSCFARKVTTGTGISNPNSITVYVGFCAASGLSGEGGTQTGLGASDPSKVTTVEVQ